MTKKEFISKVKPILKSKGYIKKNNYWYLINNDILLCINVEGSQWSKDDYYVNVGMADKIENNFPSIIKWKWVYRCIGENGDLNISVNDFLLCTTNIFKEINNGTDLDSFYRNHNAVIINGRYMF